MAGGKMLRLGNIIILMIICAQSLSASLLQDRGRVDAVFVKNDQKLSRIKGIYGLESPTDDNSCETQKFIGTIVSVTYDKDAAVQITGITLARGNGSRTFINVDRFSLYNVLSPPEAGLVHTLIGEGKKVRVDAITCGSGNFFNANNIVSLSPTKRRR